MPNVLVNDDSLKAIGNAIREKNGETTKYKPAEMAAAITAISGGSSGYIPTNDDLTIQNMPMTRLFSINNFKWLLEQYSNRLKFKKITDASYCFAGSTLTNLPNFNIELALNTTSFSSYGIGVNLTSFFDGSNLENINNNIFIIPDTYKPTSDKKKITVNRIFQNCYQLKNINDDFFNFCDINNCFMSGAELFGNCYRLKKIPTSYSVVINRNYYTTAGLTAFYYSPYSSLFSNCYCLNEITNLPVLQCPSATANTMNNTFTHLECLRKFTFENNQNANWSNTTIDLSTIGYWSNGNSSTLQLLLAERNRKMINSEETYNTWKNDEEAFVVGEDRSFYNHTSAVETINSLPDTSAYLATAGGTNTIKFKGASGSATDGGAINTMTEEEIAVATAKGWTVSFV